MAERLLLGLMLLGAGFVFGWQIRADLAAKECAAAGGVWVEPGVCSGVGSDGR